MSVVHSCFSGSGFWCKRVTGIVTLLLFSVFTLVQVQGAADSGPLRGDRADNGDQPGLGVDPPLTILPGRDMWATQPSSVTFGGTSPLPPIPMGFFFPGSNPFSGTILLKGSPIDLDASGGADTIIRRPVPANLPTVPSTDTIPIELVALSLVSINPIMVNPGGNFFDVFIGLEPFPPSQGQMTIRRTGTDNGVFDCPPNNMQVFAHFRFRKVGGGPDLHLQPQQPSVHLGSIQSHPWSTTTNGYAPPGSGPNFYPVDQVYPVNGQGVDHPVRPPPPPDYHETWIGPSPGGNRVQFGTPQNPSIPGGFFGQNSDAFAGQINFQGVPINPSLYGSTSLIGRRPGPPVNPIDPVGTMGTVPIELVALSLTSVNPITVTYNGGLNPELWRVDIGLSQNFIQQQGSVTATKTHANGGTFDSVMPVRPRLTFTRQSDSAMRTLDDGRSYPMSSTGDHFVHDVDPVIDQQYYIPQGAEWVSGIRQVGLVQTVVIVDEIAPGMVTHTVCPPRRPPPPPDYHATWISDDLLDTNGTQFTFGGQGSPPIPQGFFGNGSLQYAGQVTFVGQPINQALYGNSSVCTQRPLDPVRPSNPVGTTGTVPIEIVQLSLRSIEPIVVDYGTRQELWDVHVDLSSVPHPQGSMTATKTHANGGTWNAVLPVQARFTFTCVGPGGGCSPLPHILDTGTEGQPPIQFRANGQPFVHQAATHITNEYYIDPAAQFVPGIDETTHGDPASQQPVVTDVVDQPFPARHRICPPRRTERVCMWRVTCADGPCPLCQLCTGDLCQLDRCVGANPTCAAPLPNPTTCGPNCCLQYTFVACQLPNNEPICPRQLPCQCNPNPGACCHLDGTCSVVTECECDGTYRGDNTVCSGVVGACCFLTGSCAMMDRDCCLLQGGLFEGGTCDPPVSCCLPDGSCINTDPQCCLLRNGTPGPAGSLCGAPRRCCINGTCIDTDPACCQARGGVVGPGICGPLLECCLPASPVCVNDDNFCCQTVLLGVPGNAPCTFQECCLPNGTCIMSDPDCCTPEGIPGPAGSVCDPVEECCFATGLCSDLEPDCCVRNGGVPGGPGSQCDLPIEACCLPVGAGGVGGCAQAEVDCCVSRLGGFPDGVGACLANRACCLATGACISDDPDCCPNRGGVPRPAGSTCSAPQACCLNNGTCVSLDPECCLAVNGVPQGVASACTQLRACCLPGGACLNLDPLCCDEAGGLPAGPMCLGDLNGNMRDDACEANAPNPPVVPGPPHNEKKNRYISFVPNNGANMVAFQVTLTSSLYFPGSVGFVGWVGTPNAAGMCLVNPAPTFRVWSEPVLHVGDCEIHPVGTWDVRATPNGVTFSAPLMLMTINRPAPKFWCDTVGSFGGVTWTGPQGVVNFNDPTAAVQCFQGLPSAPHVTWVDVESVSIADPCVNRICNFADVFMIVGGFLGNPYPFIAPGACGICPP